jgi:hypothetical protein
LGHHGCATATHDLSRRPTVTAGTTAGGSLKMALFIEINNELVNLDRIERVIYDQELDRTTLHFTGESTTAYYNGDGRAAILTAAGGMRVEV